MSTSDWLISRETFAITPEEGWVYLVATEEAIASNSAFQDLHIGRYAFDVFWDHVATNDCEYRFFPHDNSFNTTVPRSTRKALRAAWADYCAGRYCAGRYCAGRYRSDRE
jgi:hypothetical protein